MAGDSVHSSCRRMKFETLCIHAHQEPEPPNYPATYPIYLSSTFYTESVEKYREVLSRGLRFDYDKRGTYIYSRGANPTVRAFELLMADLEGAEDGVAFASGMGAISAVLLALLKSGDAVVATDVLYGGTYSLLKEMERRFGIRVSFVDTSDEEAVKESVAKERPRMVYIETPANPTLKITPIKAVSEIAHDAGALVVVDNTFATPYFQNPIKLGADVVVHSATKYLSGHSDVLGGVAVGSYDLMEKVRRSLVEYGAVLDPFAAWLIMRGIKTLHVRMEAHQRNSLRIARWLEERGFKVNHPMLPSFPQHGLAKSQMRGYGGVISFDVGSYEAAAKLVNSVQLILRAVSLGGVESLIAHPASMIHFAIPKEERERLGITDGLVRLSVGLENVEDLIADLEQAMRKAGLL